MVRFCDPGRAGPCLPQKCHVSEPPRLAGPPSSCHPERSAVGAKSKGGFMAETIPEVIQPASSGDYFEVMTRAVFQAGVSWKQIATHWDAYREAFAGFDPTAVAAYDDFDVERVLA